MPIFISHNCCHIICNAKKYNRKKLWIALRARGVARNYYILRHEIRVGICDHIAGLYPPFGGGGGYAPLPGNFCLSDGI